MCYVGAVRSATRARLSQPLILCVKGQGMMGQMVDLMNKEGYSINQLLANVDGEKS